MVTETYTKAKALPKIYTGLIVYLPIVSVYASGISGFTIGDVLLFLFFLFRVATGIRNKILRIGTSTSAILLLITSIPLITLLSISRQQNIDIYSIVTRVIRRMFYYLSVVIISSKWFDAYQGKRNIILTGKIGAIYLFVQYIAYYGAHIVLHGYSPFLRVYHEHYSQIDYQQLYLNMFRPTSFLLEPAHISRYLVI